MTSLEFEDKLKAMLTKYDVGWNWNCDLTWHSTGMLFYGKDGSGEYTKFLTHVTGISFNENDEIDGDLDGFLKEVEKELTELISLTS
jgi:hypothetical protein